MRILTPILVSLGLVGAIGAVPIPNEEKKLLE
jgi:hypothetical protein